MLINVHMYFWSKSTNFSGCALSHHSTTLTVIQDLRTTAIDLYDDEPWQRYGQSSVAASVASIWSSKLGFYFRRISVSRISSPLQHFSWSTIEAFSSLFRECQSCLRLVDDVHKRCLRLRQSGLPPYEELHDSFREQILSVQTTKVLANRFSAAPDLTWRLQD